MQTALAQRQPASPYEGSDQRRIVQQLAEQTNHSSVQTEPVASGIGSEKLDQSDLAAAACLLVPWNKRFMGVRAVCIPDHPIVLTPKAGIPLVPVASHAGAQVATGKVRLLTVELQGAVHPHEFVIQRRPLT